MSGQVFVDDRDPQLIYFGDWLLDGTGNPKIYDGTLSECQTASSGVTFQFNGTQISVFGTLRGLSNSALPPISTYKIDGGNPVTYAAPNITQEGDGLLFFSSDTLTSASHVLVINVTRASQGGPYMLDYFAVTTGDAAVSSSSSSSASSSSSSVSSPSPSPSPSSSPSLSASASGSSGTGAVRASSSIAGPVAGGVIGGLVLLTVIILGIFWCRRRRRAGPIPDFIDSPRATTDMSQGYPGAGVSSFTRAQGYDYSPGMTTPFLATHTDSTSPTKAILTADSASRPSISQTPVDSSFSQSQSQSQGPSAASAQSGQSSTSGSRSAASSKAALLNPVRPLPQPQLSDSGMRFRPGGAHTDVPSEAGELPPAYTAD